MKVYNQIKFEERKSLYVMRQEGKRVDDVAVQLKRHRSTSQVVDGLKQGDLTFNHGNQSINLSVVIEKKSRYIKIIKNESKKALEIGKSLLNAVGSFPKNFVKTVTFDNGLKFAKHRALRDFFDVKTFFSDPHSPWQKPQVENVNRLIHNLLNHRPRKCLNFKTPHEVFYELVALRP